MRMCEFRHMHMKVQYMCLRKICHPLYFVCSPVARLWQWNNTQSYGLPGFKDLHCVRRWLWLLIRPHTCSGAHGSLCGRRNARLWPSWADQRFSCSHQCPTGTYAIHLGWDKKVFISPGCLDTEIQLFSNIICTTGCNKLESCTLFTLTFYTSLLHCICIHCWIRFCNCWF